MQGIRLLGSGSYLPERILHNRDLEAMVDTSDDWIFERTGIRERRLVAPGQSVVDLAEQAARAALAKAQQPASSIDLIIVATSTPNMAFPSVACQLQHRLGLAGSPALDLQAACTGFIYALSVAEKYLQTGAASTALVVGAETMSQIVDWQDRATCILFGDGAGAVLLGLGEPAGLLATRIHADGRYGALLNVPQGEGYDLDGQPAKQAYLRMQGGEVFKVAVQTLGGLVDETLQARGLSHADIDWLVPHQANLRIIQSVAKRLHLPMQKVVVTVDRHGNTSAASIPLALDEALGDGRIQAGQLVLLEAFGGGFTWGSALLRL